MEFPGGRGTGTVAALARAPAPMGRPRRIRAPRRPRETRAAGPASYARRLVAERREERGGREGHAKDRAHAADDGREQNPEEGFARGGLVQLLGADDDEIRRPHAGHETSEQRDDVCDVRDTRVAHETKRALELRTRRRERADDHERDVKDRRSDEKSDRDEQGAQNDLADERPSTESRESRVLRRDHPHEAGAENRPPDRAEDETDPSHDDAEEQRAHVIAGLPREAPGLVGRRDEELRGLEEGLRSDRLRLPREAARSGRRRRVGRRRGRRRGRYGTGSLGGYARHVNLLMKSGSDFVGRILSLPERGMSGPGVNWTGEARGHSVLNRRRSETMPTARKFLILLAGAAFLGGCSSTTSPLPLTDTPPPAPSSSSVFAGHARALRFVQGAWVAAPEYDYDFLVLERRFTDHWEAIKEIHRRHPRYDGRAGPRDQTLYFLVHMSPALDGGYDLVAEGSLGRGSGHEKAGGGALVLELANARKGWFVPFDTIRIRQERTAVEGRCQETVELLSKGKGREIPFMKMEEEGLVYRPVRP